MTSFVDTVQAVERRLLSLPLDTSIAPKITSALKDVKKVSRSLPCSLTWLTVYHHRWSSFALSLVYRAGSLYRLFSVSNLN